MSDEQELQATSAVDPELKGVIIPKCPRCNDPLNLKRLRYDFPDGVIVEVIFCANLECRVAIGAQIVGFEKPKQTPSPKQVNQVDEEKKKA